MGLYRVRIDDGQSVQVRKWFIPEYAENSLPSGNSLSGKIGLAYSWPETIEGFNYQAGFQVFTIATFPPASVMFVRAGYETFNNAYSSVLAPAGFTNLVVMSQNLVGHKWIFDNGNYILVKSFSDVNNVSAITVDYCLSTGIVCLQDVSISSTLYNGRNDYNTYCSIAPIPWYTGNPNAYDVIDLDLYGRLTGQLELDSSWVGGRVISQALARQFFEGIEPMDGGNPYSPGGYSDETDEPEGNFSDESDDVEPDDMPDEYHYSAVGSGLVTLFSPTITQLNRLSAYFWSSNVRDFILNNVAGVSEMFISLGLLPFQQNVGATVNPSWFDISDTTLRLTLAAKQFYEFDMGNIDMSNDSRIFTSGSALDYSPYSRLGIYLPFIGYQELDVDECRGSVLNLKYRIDVLTGCCVALISISGKTIYQFAGNCLTQIPITARDMSGLLTSATQIITAGVGLGIAGAVASAGAEVTTERMAAGEMTAAEGELSSVQRAGRVSNAQGVLASSTANAAMGIKPTYKKTGAISASNSLLAVRQPYLFLITPRQSLPERYQKYCGFPSNITGKLNTFSGYTVVEDIRLNGLVATSSEVEEIYKLLKTGVII